MDEFTFLYRNISSNKKINSTLLLYTKQIRLRRTYGSIKRLHICLLDLSKKQTYVTKINFDGRVLITVSNGSFLKKITQKNYTGSKKKFFLSKDFLFFLFTDILNIKKKITLIVKGHSNDLYAFFQKIEKLSFLGLFDNILLQFSGTYTFNKNKRIRSIKKRLKKSFLKNENRILHKNI